MNETARENLAKRYSGCFASYSFRHPRTKNWTILTDEDGQILREPIRSEMLETLMILPNHVRIILTMKHPQKPKKLTMILWHGWTMFRTSNSRNGETETHVDFEILRYLNEQCSKLDVLD